MNGIIRRQWRAASWLAGMLVLTALCQATLAQEVEDDEFTLADCDEDCYAKTLFQWSYGNGFGGGAPRDEPLVTDRPDFTEASTTVGRGVVQLEMGYRYTFDDTPTTSTASDSYPEALLRVGLFEDWFELRLGWNYAHQTDRVAGTATRSVGADDLYVGAKLALTPQEGVLPEMALIPQMFVPTGSSAFTAGEVLPGVNWIYGWEINDCFSTAGQSQINWVLDDTTARKYAEFSQSWTLGYSITERVGSFIEWYSFFPSGADTAKPEHYVDGGFTFLVHNDLQLDVSAGVGLNAAADDYFISTGLSYRY